MRVNITYSVDLQDVPDEVEKLLDEESKLLTTLTNKIKNVESWNALERLETLNDARVILAELDVRLAECVSMLSGYIDLMSKNPDSLGPKEAPLEVPDDENL